MLNINQLIEGEIYVAIYYSNHYTFLYRKDERIAKLVHNDTYSNGVVSTIYNSCFKDECYTEATYKEKQHFLQCEKAEMFVEYKETITEQFPIY